jgi:hypothetical protein
VDELAEVDVVVRAGLVVAEAAHEVVGGPLRDVRGPRQLGAIDLDDGRVGYKLVVGGSASR